MFWISINGGLMETTLNFKKIIHVVLNILALHNNLADCIIIYLDKSYDI